ncbi:MAG: hypothetical protein Q8Q73_11245, partial [Stagnimonas sp.]|nr:hypothetical protein [Stagnimonas sp.]
AVAVVVHVGAEILQLPQLRFFQLQRLGDDLGALVEVVAEAPPVTAQVAYLTTPSAPVVHSLIKFAPPPISINKHY